MRQVAVERIHYRKPFLHLSATEAIFIFQEKRRFALKKRFLFEKQFQEYGAIRQSYIVSFTKIYDSLLELIQRSSRFSFLRELKQISSSEKNCQSR